MNYPSIRIEGGILSADVLDRLEDAAGQQPTDFGFDPSTKVKDEIARAWADAQDYWRIFQRKLASLKPNSPATTETRNHWVVPLLGLLGYQLEYQARGAELNGKSYAISHRVINRSNTPLHIIGVREPSGLDRKPEKAMLRMSAHALVQEYLNLHDELYGLVTNGHLLRLLRDSSRLVKLTYLEFDLERIFSDGLFADFAILFRLLHASRLPLIQENAAESIIERYHQDSLDSGARIRDRLSYAVEEAIKNFANGFLTHLANDALRQAVVNKANPFTAEAYYQSLLRLIYRLLFLMVIEDRDLVFPSQADTNRRAIYDHYYSVQRLRRLAEKPYLADRRQHDLWLALLTTFHLFEEEGPGHKLGIAPLGGDLFGAEAIGPLRHCTLSNDVLLHSLRALSLYEHPETKQKLRVNYAALNVEEFGSVYEGLLEKKPDFLPVGYQIEFVFAQGDKRAVTGSHYTPDNLVVPLLKHSLDHLIAQKLKEANPEKALLSLRVADITCGSGHILLAAARRIATALATVRTGEEQPSPVAFRTAVRDVIRTCIFGVDLNPLAVELCKVALWLEAHNPGEPLNFLDHHIKCGNAIVGYVQREEIEIGIPDEAFVTLPSDDKAVAAALRKRNKEERVQKHQQPLALTPQSQQQLDQIIRNWRTISALPERTPVEIETKKQRYQDFTASGDAWLLNQIAAIPIAQFYLPKTVPSRGWIITDNEFRQYWQGERTPQGQATATAWAMALQKRFFHWFLEFPEIMARGGFDCILGNPPYLGDKHLSGTYGHPFCTYVKWSYAPVGLSDLVVYFIRRIYNLLRPGGFTAFITTNSIKDGDIRKDGLEQVLAQGGAINFAIRGIKWPGHANLVVSLISIYKGAWQNRLCVLDGQNVSYISAFLEDFEDSGTPQELTENAALIFNGIHFRGDGFLITSQQANAMATKNPQCEQVLIPCLNGEELNGSPQQQPSRYIINFMDWPLEKAQKFTEAFEHVLTHVKPERETLSEAILREKWWIFERARIELWTKLKPLEWCLVVARTTKHLCFSRLSSGIAYTNAIHVFTTNRWDLYTIVQSTVHEVWARKYSGSLKQDLRYSPSKCFDTFPFPAGLWQTANQALAAIGERYHEERRALMRHLWLGLTDLYNLFHNPDLTPALVAKVSKQPDAIATAGYQGLIDLRTRHRELDLAVVAAYGWADPSTGSGQALDLGHAFHAIDTLPENDRIRYTISPSARKELLRRLLALNHERAAEEMKAGLHEKKGKKKKDDNDTEASSEQMSMFQV
ncbi:MAG: restriction endonuclease [Caldilinea sp. CFX5]|nr:restriction endonuclease [Caldilinea sp. CFX5]